MALAIFDLDNTLLAGDSDYLWGQFLVQQGFNDCANNLVGDPEGHIILLYKQISQLSCSRVVKNFLTEDVLVHGKVFG